MHPSRKLLAVAEKCSWRAPNVYLYEYPSLILRGVLTGGTEHAYSAAAFDGALCTINGGNAVRKCVG